MTREQVALVHDLLGFVKGQMGVGRTPQTRRQAMETAAALSAMIMEHELMLTHINTCPVAKEEAERGNASTEDGETV